MKGIGILLLNIAVALYLFTNGIMGFNGGGEFASIAGSIFKGDLANLVVIILSAFAIVGGVFMLLAFFKINIPITDLIIFIFVIVWVVFIVIVDIINPLGNGFGNFLNYLARLASHLMVLGALVMSSRKLS